MTTNPTTAYPKPPFGKPTQPFPGLAGLVSAAGEKHLTEQA
ncbi:hypothetical protein [Allorhizobium taibaishanense]|uniref:Uncharacterized protein n=1 Tax=Allorhizobium taibaishanense TaxID=887144 RepID=A0A7W6HMV0_9HYPH|nr:hypothetical protein [Allorhizobium taibaishanense]MBB4008108.1 hypothetical protein [Allorhizobium taibaishanense]